MEKSTGMLLEGGARSRSIYKSSSPYENKN